MHPVDHSMSTAVTLGLDVSCWPEFMPVHHWMDATKAVHAYIPHRALRHHREGIEWLCARRGDTFVHSGGSASLRSILEQHLMEDTSIDTCLPRVADWLEAMDVPEWMPSSVPSAAAMAEDTTRKYGGDGNAWLALHQWFLDDMGYERDNRYLCMRHHSFGIFDAEEHFGYVVNNVPLRVVAENHVKKVMGRIPHTSAWLKCFRMKRWMSPDPVVVSSVRNSYSHPIKIT